jgi:tungstate transport system substrate-binding protein
MRPALLAACLIALLASPAQGEESSSLLLATTTSVRDSGLLDDLLPLFTAETGIEVKAVAVGTGAALRMGAEGNADVLLTHAASAEQKLVDSGAVSERVPFMENHFVLAGPDSDPAGVRGAPDVATAIRKIRESGAPFVSRGDDSGTHKREVAVFREAGLDPDERFPGLVRTGSGMGLSLQVAGQKEAYILSDIGTYLAFRESTGLVVLSQPEASLRNVYALLRVSVSRFPRVHDREARAFQAFLLREDTLARIAKFGQERFGRPLFRPLDGAAGGI